MSDEHLIEQIAEDALEVDAVLDTEVAEGYSEEDAELDSLYKDAEGKGAKLETDKGTEGKDKKNKKSTDAKASAASAKVEKPSMKEDMDALFDGEELSEDFKEKASAIFEGAVSRRVDLIEAEINSLIEEKIEEGTNERVETLVESVNDYLAYVVTEWVAENEIAIENGLRTDITESFIRGLRDLLVDNYIDLPEERADAFDALSDKMESLEESSNEILAENIALKKSLLESHCANIFAKVSSDMVMTDVEKLTELAEGLEFDSAEQYESKLGLLKQSYFESAPVSDDADVVTESNEPVAEEAPAIDPVMARYLSAAVKSNKA